TVLKASDAFAQSLHHFRDAPATKENQHHGQNHQPVKNTKLTHELPPPLPWRSGWPHSLAWLEFPLGRKLVWSIPYRITRSSPARRVNLCRSRCSTKAIPYFRVTPVN